MYKKSLFIFRRDLRLFDNTGLIAASQKSDQVLPVFFLNDQQIDSTQNRFFSLPAFQFMLTSLEDLAQDITNCQGTLSIFSGNMYENFEQILRSKKIEAVFVNTDYTPFSQDRDQKLSALAAQYNVAWHSFADALLLEPAQAKKDDGTPYTVFTPFYRKNRVQALRVVDTYAIKNMGSLSALLDLTLKNNLTLSLDWAKDFFSLRGLGWNADLAVQGGRSEGLYVREKITNTYDEDRNIPIKNATSLLSAHHKFGTVSIRESYWFFRKKFGFEHTLLSELFWRDFFTHIGYHFPKVFSGAFKDKYNNIVWKNCEKKFEAWCQGKTGFPIVDAGMRELNTTGFMHNRVRMITASFLVKNLHIDWRWGEKYFAQKLVDYDPCVNNGNWQWAASTGCDAQPYFRIFNPWSQQQKFDQDTEYIKKWIPELQDLAPKEIHQLEKKMAVAPPNNLFGLVDQAYPLPIINNKTTALTAKEMYKICL